MQALFLRSRLHVRLLTSVTSDMDDLHPAGGEDATDEQATVTVDRALLGAQHRNAMRRDARLEPLDPLQEGALPREPRVVDVAVGVVHRRIARATAKLGTHRHVLESGVADGCAQTRLVELRRIPTERAGPNVGDDVDLRGAKETDQRVERHVRMADRVDGRH